jgi:hypothetical protein
VPAGDGAKLINCGAAKTELGLDRVSSPHLKKICAFASLRRGRILEVNGKKKQGIRSDALHTSRTKTNN